MKTEKTEKNYKNHPFRIGMKVYDGNIEGIISNELVEAKAGYPINIIISVGFKDYVNQQIDHLSFTPYEINSNWERPFEPEIDDLVIAWMRGEKKDAIIGTLDQADDEDCPCPFPYGVGGGRYSKIVKFESMEQYNKIKNGDL